MRQPQPANQVRTVWFLAAGIALVFVVDRIVAVEVPLFLFYWVPVLLAATFASTRLVLMLAVEALVFALLRSSQIGLFSHPDYVLRLSAMVLTALLAVRLTQAREQREAQMSQVTSDREATLKALPDLLFEVTPEGRIVEIHSNPLDSVMASDRWIGRHFTDLLQPEAHALFHKALQEAQSDETCTGGMVKLPTRGELHWFELSLARKRPVHGRPQTTVVLARDVHSRLEAETALRRQMGFYTILSRCNQAIVESSSQEGLLQRICQEAVVTGDLTLAWVGLVNTTTRNVDPVAMAGEGSAYLDNIRITTQADSPYGQGPTARSIREDRPFWIQDFQNDPITLPWHQRAQQFGWRASASIPLHREGSVVGAMTLYAQEPFAFSEEIKLLILDMATDIDLALDRFARAEREHEIQLALQRSEREYRELTETIHDVIWRIDACSLRILYVSPSIQSYLGYRADSLVGQSISSFLHEKGLWWLDSLTEFGQQQPAQDGPDPVKDFRLDEIPQRHRDGQLVWGEMTTTVVLNGLTGDLEFHCVTRDITLRKQAEERLEWLSYYDSLTALPNRNLIDRLVEQALRVARRESRPLAVMILGLDRFKSIKDATGYTSGDLILQETASRLRHRLRDEDLISRIDGDEFLIALPGVGSDQAAQLCTMLQDIVRMPYAIERHSISLTCSIGVALYPDDGDSCTVLMRNADIALSHAKREGRDSFHFFTSALEERVMRTMALANGLRGCLDREEMGLIYQPQIDARTGAVVGAEALLRWNHPSLGVLSPGEFIPVAETTGQIVILGEWVLQQAIRQLRQWQREGLGVRTMAVNLSAAQFRQDDLASRVIALLNEEGLPANALELELTESVMLHDPEAAIEAMARFSDAGIELSIDDFGTGYSSLSYLKRLRVNKLKIDASFIRDLAEDRDDLSIVTAIINLAKSLRMTTIAEGVEAEAQLAILRRLGCDEIQGYIYARPLSPDDFAAFCRRQLEPQPGAA